jgi:Trk K+ transport system NAD-binding subunit
VARAICVYRADAEFLFAEPDLRLKAGDEVVVLTHADGLKALRERFAEAAGQ